jgi:hypothetical protein
MAALLEALGLVVVALAIVLVCAGLTWMGRGD